MNYKNIISSNVRISGGDTSVHPPHCNVADCITDYKAII